MNSTNQTVPKRAGNGVKILSAVITLTVTFFAIARVTNLFVSSSPRNARNIPTTQTSAPWGLPDDIFADCTSDHAREAIAIDYLATPAKQLGDAWKFSAHDGSANHALLNTGWGKRKKTITPQKEGKIAAQSLMQSIPQGNFAYAQGTALHPVSENKYPEFKNTPWQSSRNPANQTNHSSNNTGNSYAGGRGTGGEAATSQGGTGTSMPQNQKATRSHANSQSGQTPESSPVQRAADTIISIIDNKMLSNEKQGSTAFSKSETDQALTQLEQLVIQNMSRTGSQPKDQIGRVQAKLAVTDVINHFYEALRNAKRPGSAIPALSSEQQTKFHNKKAATWSTIKTMVQAKLETAPTDKKTNMYEQVCHVYDKLDTLLTRMQINPTEPAVGTEDHFKETRTLEGEENLQSFITNKNLTGTAAIESQWKEWIEYLAQQINTSFGTPWFNPIAIQHIMGRIQSEIEKAIQNKKNAPDGAEGLTQLQDEIEATFDGQITNPLFMGQLGLDLATYRDFFDTLTKRSDASKLQNLARTLQESGLNQTGAQQLEILIKGFMGMWVALSSGFSGPLGGAIKQIMYNATNYLCSPDGKDMINKINSVATSAIGIKAVSGIFSSTTSSLITLAAISGLYLKIKDINNNTTEEERAEKIQNVMQTIGQWGDMATGFLQNILPSSWLGGASNPSAGADA